MQGYMGDMMGIQIEHGSQPGQMASNVDGQAHHMQHHPHDLLVPPAKMAANTPGQVFDIAHELDIPGSEQFAADFEQRRNRAINGVNSNGD